MIRRTRLISALHKCKAFTVDRHGCDGIVLQHNSGKITISSTRGDVLVSSSIPIGNLSEDVTTAISIETCNRVLKRLRSSRDKYVEMSIEGTSNRLYVDGVEYLLMEDFKDVSEYMDYSEKPNRVMFDRKRFRSIIQRLQDQRTVPLVLSEEGLFLIHRIDGVNYKLEISKCYGGFKGESLNVIFDRKTIEDVLKRATAEYIVMYLANNNKSKDIVTKPVTIYDDGAINTEWLVVTMSSLTRGAYGLGDD